jgi:hypothetical protein
MNTCSSVICPCMHVWSRTLHVCHTYLGISIWSWAGGGWLPAWCLADASAAEGVISVGLYGFKVRAGILMRQVWPWSMQLSDCGMMHVSAEQLCRTACVEPCL